MAKKAKKATKRRKATRKKKVAVALPVKLNLGAGGAELPGYVNIDRATGGEAYPLTDYADNSVDEIRASHLLEHFSHRQTAAVLAEWVRALKPGGLLKVAVPNFTWIIEQYNSEKAGEYNLEGYLMGGHTDDHDCHGAIFNEQKLGQLMTVVGLTEIKRWTADAKDCSSLPVSLNLQGTKPTAPVSPAGELPVVSERRSPLPMKVCAAMSTPRLGFMDNFFCAFQALLPLRIGLRKHTGAFWGQCVERCMEQVMDEGAEAILAIDYDTVFARQDVETLVKLLHEHPEADAISTVQASRTRGMPMMTVRGPDGKNIPEVTAEFFEPDLTQIHTAHFGLTLIRVSSLVDMPHPWFWSTPGPDGTWNDDRTDDDIYFWRQWEKAGKTLYLANRVPIAHAEMMLIWPDKEFGVMYQHPSKFYDEGKPKEVWQ